MLGVPVGRVGAHPPCAALAGRSDGDFRSGASGGVRVRVEAVARAEQRWLFGGDSSLLAVGATAFGDVGKVWAGDVPFGVTSDVRASAGISLLASVPRESRRLLRVDLAIPLVDDSHAKYEIRVSTSRTPREFWREPGDIARLRAVLPPVGVFGWR